MNKKYQKKVAKLMFKNSLSYGFLDENKVRKILFEVTKTKTRGTSSILKLYKRLVASQLSKEQIIIEAPLKIDIPKSTHDRLISKLGAKRIKFVQNDDIVIGARVTHGDWIFDRSLDSKLEAIKGVAKT